MADSELRIERDSMGEVKVPAQAVGAADGHTVAGITGESRNGCSGKQPRDQQEADDYSSRECGTPGRAEVKRGCRPVDRQTGEHQAKQKQERHFTSRGPAVL